MPLRAEETLTCQPGLFAATLLETLQPRPPKLKSLTLQARPPKRKPIIPKDYLGFQKRCPGTASRSIRKLREKKPAYSRVASEFHGHGQRRLRSAIPACGTVCWCRDTEPASETEVSFCQRRNGPGRVSRSLSWLNPLYPMDPKCVCRMCTL